jgi:hypothetical protein
LGVVVKQSNDPINFFDHLSTGFDVQEAMKQEQERRNEGEELDALIFSVFNTESGQELLEKWKKALIMTPTAIAGDDLISVGINEGQKSFIRAICITVDKVKRGQCGNV